MISKYVTLVSQYITLSQSPYMEDSELYMLTVKDFKMFSKIMQSLGIHISTKNAAKTKFRCLCITSGNVCPV